MDNSTVLDVVSVGDAGQFFHRAKDWYFGGYLKMDTEKAPDPMHLIAFLRVLGFRASKKETSVTGCPQGKNEYRIEINCNNPLVNVQMEFPSVTPPDTNSGESDEGGIPMVSHEIPVSKLKVVKEVFEMLMEFLMEQDGANKRKDNVLDNQQWRRCMSLSMLGSPAPQFRLPLKNPDEMRISKPPQKETAVKVVVVDTESGLSNKGLNQSSISNELCVLESNQEEAMEVDVPAISNSSLGNSSLSPIGLARQRTWVLEGSKLESKKEFDKANTSTPTKPYQSTKIGVNKIHGISKILRPRQARTEVQTQRLKSANTEAVRSITQIRNAKGLSSRTPNKSKSSLVASNSSISSHSSADATRSNVIQKTGSKLSVPSRTTLTVSAGAKPKQPTCMGVSRQPSSISSDSSTLGGVTTRSRRPQMKKEGGMSSPAHVQKKEDHTPLLKPKGNEPEQLSADRNKLGVKRRPSLLPRFNLTHRNLIQNKGSKASGDT